MARRAVLEFWYELASTYSYLSAMRIEELAGAAGVEVRWRPFLLGPIFAAQGWNSSPFNLFPVKGRYMWRDMEREGARFGLPVKRPDPFPQNSLVATRVALLGAEHPWGPTFTKAVYAQEFGEGRSIAEPAAVAGILKGLGLDGDAILKTASAEPNKTRLKAVTEEARSRGLFGAPTFLTDDGEMFWGNDRLELAIAWASGERPGR
ncbi:2-hydroxychromene-2-carboxylate isomerase [Salinarimonas soli]|uniref:2-hydroxychromene-2-carboxylate isomerase n=1 Tax=Salinarimonas soli TaxID=1638099 RepID=A0A5B2VTY2_9HYPH|nr:2-hydroxychromene-2-carboxylate isomerase [Salinarimonas soli]KAA2242120.1 2-hydroxychromene-2-carboxylate isomerase [Salinarimonas soli]